MDTAPTSLAPRARQFLLTLSHNWNLSEIQPLLGSLLGMMARYRRAPLTQTQDRRRKSRGKLFESKKLGRQSQHQSTNANIRWAYWCRNVGF
jgi:hypothetical protein